MTAARSILEAGFAALLSVHGEPATFIPAGGAATTIIAIFNEAGQVVEFSEGASVISTRPTAKTWTSSVPNARNGDRFGIGANTYKVIEPKINGLGVTTLILSRETWTEDWGDLAAHTSSDDREDLTAITVPSDDWGSLT